MSSGTLGGGGPFDLHPFHMFLPIAHHFCSRCLDSAHAERLPHLECDLGHSTGVGVGRTAAVLGG